jgi:predicted nucleic acid-binding protein
MLVVDASMILALILDDESSILAQAVVEAMDSNLTFAPDILWYEVRNALVVNERRGRHTKEQSAAFIGDIESLPITLRPPPIEHTVLNLARKHKLSVYDASYLDLAVRYGAKLATLDRRLASAAIEEGVDCWSEVVARLDAG